MPLTWCVGIIEPESRARSWLAVGFSYMSESTDRQLFCGCAHTLRGPNEDPKEIQKADKVGPDVELHSKEPEERPRHVTP